MVDAKSYHHGNLRAALLTAAEAELIEAGIEKFSLRSFAKRAGVSHAAPAYHFRDVDGILTALATVGFRRFIGFQERRAAKAPDGPRDRLLAGGLAYVDFAMAHPELFRLIFVSNRIDLGDPDLSAAGDAAYRLLQAQVAAAGGDLAEGAIHWAMSHGFADLIISGRLKYLTDLPPDARDALLLEMFSRACPL